jgi:hypothetical protein
VPGRVNGVSLAYTATGAVVLWSGIKGTSVSDTFRSLLSGQPDTTVTEPITGSAGTAAGTGGTAPAGNTGASSASAAANQAIARLLAAPYGWSTGQQWADLVSLWNRESNWESNIINPSSGAFGIAQALGHGVNPGVCPLVVEPGGTVYGRNVTINQYPSSAANSGDAASQISWGLPYIRDTYGSPSAAWAHEVAKGWY